MTRLKTWIKEGETNIYLNIPQKGQNPKGGILWFFFINSKEQRSSQTAGHAKNAGMALMVNNEMRELAV
jgi:hypothetical protein